MLKTDRKRKLLRNDRFTTLSGHFFANYMNIFHKTEVQTVNLRCLTDLNPNLFKSYDTKCQHFHFPFFAILKKKIICVFALVTFEPIKIQTCSASQNDRLNFSFVKDIHVVGEKMARNGGKTDI